MPLCSSGNGAASCGDILHAFSTAWTARPTARNAACGCCHTITLCLQIAPIADAGSAQSRADVLLIGMSGALILTGLQVSCLKPETRSCLRCVMTCC